MGISLIRCALIFVLPWLSRLGRLFLSLSPALGCWHCCWICPIIITNSDSAADLPALPRWWFIFRLEQTHIHVFFRNEALVVHEGVQRLAQRGMGVKQMCWWEVFWLR